MDYFVNLSYVDKNKNIDSPLQQSNVHVVFIKRTELQLLERGRFAPKDLFDEEKDKIEWIGSRTLRLKN